MYFRNSRRNKKYLDYIPGTTEFRLRGIEERERSECQNVTLTGFQRRTLKAERTIDLNDPFENTFRVAEGAYLRQNGPGTIKEIDIVSNPDLNIAFEKKIDEFKRANKPCKPIYAFHGTKVCVIDNILKTNFDISRAKRQAHGRGNYFSEYPTTALDYSDDRKHLIFCKLLPGNQYKGPDSSWPEYDSKLVNPHQQTEVSKMVIIQNKDQILPICVIKLE